MVVRRLALILAAGSVGAGAQSPVPPEASRPGEVVVTARPRDAADALRDCLTRKCSPDEDIKATLDQSATQFVNGDYQGSRATLYASRKRNGRFAKQYPVQVAALHGAITMVSAHLGDGAAAWSGRLDRLSALKAGLPDGDMRVLLGRIDLGDGYVFAGRYIAAIEEYRDTAARARKSDLPTIEGAALLREARLLVRLAEANPQIPPKRAQAAVAALVGRTDPALAPYATAARTLQAQLATARKHAAIDGTIAAYRPAGPTHTPQLLYAPPIDLAKASLAGDTNEPNAAGEYGVQLNALSRMAMDDFEKQWIDVAFQIGADGRVSDVRVERESPSLDGDWAKAVTRSIAGRRYAPMKIEHGDSIARLERYTFTSLWDMSTGSRIRVRSGKPRVEAIDLTSTLPG